MKNRILEIPVDIGFPSLLAHGVFGELFGVYGVWISFDDLGLFRQERTAGKPARQHHPPTPFFVKAEKDKQTKQKDWDHFHKIKPL